MQAMLIRDVSEFELIEALSRALSGPNAGPASGLSIGIGDDAAAWDSTAGTTVLTTDTLVEGVHFDLEWMAWRDLGWKALAVNLSDIAAMGCLPTYAVVTLGLRGDLPVDGVAAVYEGMAEASRRFDCAVVGGDTVRSPVLFVTVAMQGFSDRPETLLTRPGAAPGEVVAVTGTVGSSAAGLKLLQNGSGRDGPLRGLMDAHLRPQPRLEEGRALVKAGISAALDISDGLVADLTKLCEASAVGAEVDATSVPVDPAIKLAFPDDWLELALGGGEDYELLFTARPEAVERLAMEVDVPVTILGKTVAGEGVTVFDGSGAPLSLELTGWDHFKATR